MRQSRESGFTLIEMSIVLVIVGLLVGGVLVGQYLIQAAETRAVITDVDKFRAAVATFRTRFRGLPGDVRNFRQFADLNEYPNTRNGNGDKMVQQCYETESFSPTATNACSVYGSSYEIYGALNYNYINRYTGELLGFWQHLSVTGLVAGSYDGLPGNYSGAGSAPLNKRGKPGTSYPSFRLNDSLGWIAYSGKYERQKLFITPGAASGYTTNSIGQIQTPANTHQLLTNAALTTIQAQLIDRKGDDGMPKSGTIRGAMGNGNGVVTMNPGLVVDIFGRSEGSFYNNALNAADPCSSFMDGAADYDSINTLDPIYISQHTYYNTASNWEVWASEMLTKYTKANFSIDQMEDSPVCILRFSLL